MNNSPKFIKRVLLNFFIFIFFIIIFIIFVDPIANINLWPSQVFIAQNNNMVFNKAKLMEKDKSFEAIVLGSSTSETFLTSDINSIFKTKSFHASVPGSNTLIRYVLFKKALETFHELKYVFYILDFYELNHLRDDRRIYNNEMLRELTEGISYKVRQSTWQDALTTYFSFQSFMESLQVVRKYFTKKHPILLSDGTLNWPNVIREEHPIEKVQGSVDSEQFNSAIEYFYQLHIKDYLNNFDHLNPEVVDIFQKMNQLAKERKIKIFYILSPIHNLLKEKFFSHTKLKERFKEWQNEMTSYADEKNVFVFNFFEHKFLNENYSNVTHDGLHYNANINRFFLEQVKLKLKE